MRARTSWMCAAVMAACALTMATAGNADEAEDRALRAKEAELTASSLSRENRELRAELTRLQEQVRELSVSLAEAKLEADLLKTARNKAQWSGAAVPATDRALDARNAMSVLDVNAALGLVVFSAGQLDGIKPGMMLSVVRDGEAIAQVRTIDVRDEISGAVVERAGAGRFPQIGDRVVPSRAGER